MGEQDRTLGQFLQELCFGRVNCPRRRCQLPLSGHSRHYFHHDSKLTIAVSDVSSPLMRPQPMSRNRLSRRKKEELVRRHTESRRKVREIEDTVGAMLTPTKKKKKREKPNASSPRTKSGGELGAAYWFDRRSREERGKRRGGEDEDRRTIREQAEEEEGRGEGGEEGEEGEGEEEEEDDDDDDDDDDYDVDNEEEHGHGLERDGTHHMSSETLDDGGDAICTWSFCRKCRAVVTPCTRLSNATLQLSFGKLLQITFDEEDNEVEDEGGEDGARRGLVERRAGGAREGEHVYIALEDVAWRQQQQLQESVDGDTTTADSLSSASPPPPHHHHHRRNSSTAQNGVASSFVCRTGGCGHSVLHDHVRFFASGKCRIDSI